MAEAKRIHAVLQPIVAALPLDPSSTDLITAFSGSSALHDLFAADSVDFYAVAIGVSPGIHRTRYLNTTFRILTSNLIDAARASAQKSRGSFTHYSQTHTRSFWEALAFMIVKGMEERMPPLLTSAELADGGPYILFPRIFNYNIK